MLDYLLEGFEASLLELPILDCEADARVGFQADEFAELAPIDLNKLLWG